jgi:hypothetical protein
MAASQGGNIQTLGYIAGDGSRERLSTQDILTVNYSNGLFLTGTATSLSNDLNYSTDGLNWQGYSTGYGRIFGIDYDQVGGNYVMVGHLCKVIYSNNPLSSGSWANADTRAGTKDQVFAGSTNYAYDVASDGKGTMIAVGNADYRIAADGRMGISRDSGKTWKRVDLSGSSIANTSFIYEVHYLNGKWFAFGYADGFVSGTTARKAWSVDGETWWDLPNLNKGYAGLASGGGIYVAGYGDSLVYSVNGTTWVLTDPPKPTWFNAIAYGNRKFVAVTNGGEILYSNDM